jgi:hypothetical protein
MAARITAGMKLQWWIHCYQPNDWVRFNACPCNSENETALSLHASRLILFLLAHLWQSCIVIGKLTRPFFRD